MTTIALPVLCTGELIKHTETRDYAFDSETWGHKANYCFLTEIVTFAIENSYLWFILEKLLGQNYCSFFNLFSVNKMSCFVTIQTLWYVCMQRLK